jgi:NhaP-type Na+/H+ or K+/H+ antiporter/Trk K+ transport system NAD-binding subunit
VQGPAFSFALALAAGVIAQAVARRIQVPGIVLLLFTGVVLGPEVAGIIDPRSFGPSLSDIVGLSVAVILFEGGLGLNLAHLRREAVVIRRLILIGSVITAVGACFAARLAMHWPWLTCLLFGTLVMVTGPTVITPLLRRIRVTTSVSTILEAEGVLIDPVGAIVAVVALEVVLAESDQGAAHGLLGLPSRLLLGASIGAVGGFVIARLLRRGRWIPDGMENIFTLSLVLALVEISNAIVPESGILAATVAGLIAGNVNSRLGRQLREFKEQLTVLLVGMLFVLLAADVRLAAVAALGWSGVLAVALLMFVVRPVNVLVCTWGSTLTWRERTFIAWLSPRGIVAAAVASVFAGRMDEAGYPLGSELRALVFLVIAVTVVVQGLSGGWIAQRLGIRRPMGEGFLVVGANALGRAVARACSAWGEEVVLVDSNPVETRSAEEEGLTVIYGDANEESVLARADVVGKRGFIAVTPNEGINLLLASRARLRFRVPSVYVALDGGKPGVTPERASEAGADVLFQGSIDLARWMILARNGGAVVQHWRYDASAPGAPGPLPVRDGQWPVAPALVLAVLRGTTVIPCHEELTIRRGDQLALLVGTKEEGEEPRVEGWTPVEPALQMAGA